jgi:hypothetical protein
VPEQEARLHDERAVGRPLGRRLDELAPDQLVQRRSSISRVKTGRPRRDGDVERLPRDGGAGQQQPGRERQRRELLGDRHADRLGDCHVPDVHE